MRRAALLAASAAGSAALVALAVAHDARSWRSAVSRGDARFAQTQSARLGVEHVAAGRSRASGCSESRTRSALRRAVEAFVVADHAGRGFDNGEHRARVRSAASVALADRRRSRLARRRARRRTTCSACSSRSGAGGDAPDEQAIAAFQAAVRADPSNADAKYNLELALRAHAPTGVRRGPGNGERHGRDRAPRRRVRHSRAGLLAA